MGPLSRSLLTAGVVSIAAMTSWTASAKELVIGFQCDRTGPTQTVGVYLCPGYRDYINLINSQGGIDGNMIRIIEIDHEYKVPPAVEAYELFKREGAVIVSLYGTPQTQALTKKLAEDKIPGTSPGFGTAAAANGKNYPYLFPIAATYWSQVAAAVKYANDQLGSIKGKKIAYLYFDNPAGREPLPIIRKLSKSLDFTLREFAVPSPGIEMKAQALDISRRYRADFIISHLFGRAPSVQIKEMKRVGFSLNKIISLVWGASEADINAAGGFAKAQGYAGLQFAGVGTNYKVHDEIRAMYKAKGKPAPKAMAVTVFYNRGILIGAVHVAALRNAVKAKGSGDITGEDVKNGFEAIRGMSLGGMVPPLDINEIDHEGGGWVKVFQVKGDGFVQVTDWFHGYRKTVTDMVAGN